MEFLSGISTNFLTGAADRLASGLSGRQARQDSLAANALSNGVGLYQKGEYDAAAAEFKRAVGLAPFSEYAMNAYDFMATAYLQEDRTDEAIRAYRSSLQLNPIQDDAHVKLGNIYFSQGRQDDAITQYAAAVKLDPGSTRNIYSLGQAYLSSGLYAEAEEQFSRIISLAPEDYGGYYGLGQTYRQVGRLEDAVEQLKKAVSLSQDFDYGHLELGCAYADAGDREGALEQTAILDELTPGLAESLRSYLYKSSDPGIVFVSTYEAFDTTEGPGTELSSLSDDLASPGASKDFTFTFFFNKEMDLTSVSTLYNWRIGRSTDWSQGGLYNWGLSVPETEVLPSATPKNVLYDPETWTARVTFTLTQNAEGSGTIDPSHLVFSFRGKDVYGRTMDSRADEFVGINLIV